LLDFTSTREKNPTLTIMESEYVNCLVYEYLTTVNKKLAKMFKKHKRLTGELPPGSPSVAEVVKHFRETATSTIEIEPSDHMTEESSTKKKTIKRKRIDTESEEKASSKMISTEGRKIFIKNLGKKFVYEDFKEKVEQFGEVTKFLNSGRGFCFLTFSTAAAADACIASLNKTKVAGKTLQMNIAKEKPSTTAPAVPTPVTPAKDPFAKRVEGCTLFVNGVKQKTSNIALKAAFGQYGKVTESLNAGKGYAFVTFSTAGEASTAMEALNGTEVCGTTISIEVSQEGGKAWTSKNKTAQESVRLFVNNVSKDATTDELKEVFAAHGTVTDVQHHGKGFAFVSLASAGAAQAAVKALDGQIWPKFCNKAIECNIAKVQKGRKRRKKGNAAAE